MPGKYFFCKLLLIFFMSSAVILSPLPLTAEICQTVENDLRLHFPCIAFQGQYIGFDMEFFRNPADPQGLFWRIDTESLVFKDIPDEDCLTVRNNLKIYTACLEYDGISYRFVMKYAADADPSGLAWQMEISTFSEVPEVPSYGSDYLSIGEERWNTSIAYYTPESIRQTPNPGLLVYLHGDGESALSTLRTRIERDFKAVSEEKGLVVIGVQANNLGFRMVDSFGKYMTEDYYNTIDAILLAHKKWGINPYETYITGYSAGGPGAVMLARGEMKPAIRAAVIWCAPYNAYAMIPNSYTSQVPVRLVSNSGDPNYSLSFPYWQYFLPAYGHELEALAESHISGHQFDKQSVRDAVEWMLRLP